MQRLTPTFLLLVISIAFWGGAVSLSERLSAPQTDKQVVSLSPELSALEARVDAQPENLELKLEFAEKLRAEGTAENGLLMKALQTYGAVQEKDPNNARALLGLAEISFEHGVLDKARVFFERYVAVRADDLKARTDLGLVQLQMGDGDVAITTLQTVLKEHPQLFPAKLALALAYEVRGDKQQAKNVGEEALKLAPDENGKNIVSQFLTRLSKMEEGTEGVARGSLRPANGSSPAMIATAAVREHPILSSKVRKISWPDANTAHVILGDFPASKMPPFAKEKLRATLTQNLQASPEAITIKLFEENVAEPFLAVSGGGKE